MAATYEPIATTTLGSAASSITFSSIPATYTDLRLVVNVATTGATNNMLMRFNSDTGTNYSTTNFIGDGSSAASYRRTDNDRMWFAYGSYGTSSAQPTFYESDFFNYAGSTYKTMLMIANEDINGSGSVTRAVGLWRSTSVISTILIYTSGGTNMAAGTTATLYGILKA